MRQDNKTNTEQALNSMKDKVELSPIEKYQKYSIII